MSDPSKSGGSDRIHGPVSDTSRIWEAVRTGEIAEWPSSDRSLLISLIVLVLFAYPAVLTSYLTTYDDLPSFFDPAGVFVLRQTSYLTVALWAILAGVSWIGHRRGSDSAWFLHLPVQYFAINTAFFSYLMGPVTTPFFGVTLLAALWVGAPLFGRTASLLGAGSLSLLVIGASIAEQWGLIPYAPLLRGYPLEDGALSTIWLIGLGSFQIVAVGVALMLAEVLFYQLRHRANRLAETNKDLLKAHGELEHLAGELRRARDQLETRVSERTQELEQANSALMSEAARADRTSRELQRLSAAMEEAIEGIARVGADGLLQSVNPAFAAMHNTPADRMIGTPANDWVVAEDQDTLESVGGKIRAGEKVELEVSGVASEGKSFSQHLVLVGEETDGEAAHYRFARDVSVQRELTEQVTQASKMDAMGRLAGGIAHEFNNLLTAIISSGEQLKDQLEAGRSNDEVLTSIDWITTSALRAADLTGGLLAFSHSQPAEPSTFDLGESIFGIVRVLERTLGHGIEIDSQAPADNVHICVDRARFESSLMNLALNARDAMPEGGRLCFSTRVLQLEQGDFRLSGSSATAGRFLEVEVRDTGVGIPAEILPNIFEPFFTTKAVGKGTGLGLSLVYNFAQESSGVVDVKSQPGTGTAVSILLPLSDEVSPDSLRKSSKETTSGTETILVAEDEPIVADVLSRILSSRGYRVITCADGGEALEEFRKHQNEVDLVMVDLRMPVLSGAEVFDEVRTLAPSTPVILMSGNTVGPEVDGLRARGLQGVISKPYRLRELLEEVRDVLDQSARVRE